MSDAPDTIWMAANGGLPTGNYPKTELVEYVRAAAILSDPRVMALVEAAKLAIAAYEANDDRMIQGYHALVDAVAALQVKP